MRRSNWLKNKIGAILALILLVAISGCGAGGGTDAVVSSGGTIGGTTGDTGGTGGTTGGGAVVKSATLSWSPATTNSDGTPLVDLAGYRVYYGTSSGNYTNTVDISDPAATSTLIAGLASYTTYYFAVTAYDTSGNESSFSNEGVKAL